MEFIRTKIFATPYGDLILGSFQDKLCLCDWYFRKMRKEIDWRIQKELNAVYGEDDSPVTEEAIQQLTEYFSGKRNIFNIPLLFAGTDFQKQVWNELLKIPYGHTETYLSLSRRLGNKKAIRAVASANGANAISILVPCHRIIGSDGKMIGYAGGLHTKKKLLQLEGALIISGQMDMFHGN